MKFRTSLAIQEYPFKISHKDKIMTIGSCFANNISLQLNKNKFPLCENPFGVIYNPISICNGLINLINNRKWTLEDIDQSGEKYFSYDFHGSYSALSPDGVLDKIQTSTQKAGDFIRSTNILIISLGSSFAFRLHSNQKIVANCHKIPQDKFERISLSDSEIIDSLKSCINQIKEVNENISILLTVSPVRHLRDGLIANNLSKAVLLKSVHTICAEMNRIFYFPSYELLLDDLRDYRFYNSDLAHPNDQAIEYIWEYFSSSFFTDATKKLNRQLLKIHNGINHKALFPATTTYKVFVNKLLEDIQTINELYPDMDFSNEINLLENAYEQ